jgi:hypothetical protein
VDNILISVRQCWAYGACLLAVLLLWGCAGPGPDPRTLRLETSISADGKRIATLANAGHKSSRVQVMYLDRSETWIDLPTPPWTLNIRFGLQGHRLLITHLDPETYSSELSSIDVDEVGRGAGLRSTIFKGDVLAYPIEVEEGRYLVRHCKFTPVACPWNLIRDGKLEREIHSKYSLQYSQPVVVEGTGFYWMSYKSNDAHRHDPDAIAFPFDESGVFQPLLPAIDHQFDTVACDYIGTRCLQSFREKAEPGPFLYNSKVLFNGTMCNLDGVAGWSDGASMSPDGRFGVKSLAGAFELPRHAVYFEFAPTICQPVVIKHLP